MHQHDIEDREGVTCLKLGITWESVEEYEEKWGKIPDMQRGIVTAGKITETAKLKTIRIYLRDPDGEEVDIVQPRTIHDVAFQPSGCISTGYLEIITITDDTSNGYWKVIWEDDGKEVFSETFLVGEEPQEPEDEEEEEEGEEEQETGASTLTLIAILLIAVVVLAAIAVYIKRR